MTLSSLTLAIWLILLLTTNEWVQGQPVSTFVPPSTLTIAYIGCLVLPSVTSVLKGQPGLFTFHAAIQQINQASATWRANQSLPMPLLPYTTLVPIWYDSQSDSGKSVNAAYDAVQAGAIAIVGEFGSGPTQEVQYVAARYKVPQISPSASGVEFTKNHKTIYPYFLRNIPSVGIEAGQMIHFIKNCFGWKRIALFHASDTFGADGAQATAKAAAAAGVTIIVDVSFNIGDTDMSYQIQRIIESDARIIVHWGHPPELQTILLQIKAGVDAGVWPNILGDGYQWVVGHSVSVPGLYLNSTGGEATDIRNLLPGMIGLNYYVNTSTPEYIAFDQYHRSLPNWNVTTAASGNVYGQNDASVWDGVYQIARGMDWMLSHNLDPTLTANRPDFYQAIRNRTFNGATGYIANDINGDVASGFGVLNYRRKENAWVNVGVLSSTGDYTPFDANQVWEYLGTESYLTRPYDSPQRGIVNINQATQISLIFMSSFLIVLFLGVQFALYQYRSHPLIKGSSPVFLSLYVLGIQLLCASVIPRSFESEVTMSPHPCEADLWLANLGYILLIGALFVKTYRLQAIFSMTMLKTVTKLSDGHLLKSLAGLMVLESGLLLGLQYGSPMSLQLSAYNTNNNYYSCYAGSSSSNAVNTLYQPVTIAVRFACLVATAISAFRVRNIPDAFNESKQLLVTIYNLLFLSILLPVIDSAMGRGKQTSLIAYTICVFVICTLSVLIMFVPKFMNLFHIPQILKSGLGSQYGDELTDVKTLHVNHAVQQMSAAVVNSPSSKNSGGSGHASLGGPGGNSAISPSSRRPTSTVFTHDASTHIRNPSNKFAPTNPSTPVPGDNVTITTDETTPQFSFPPTTAAAPPSELSIPPPGVEPSLPIITEVVTHPNQVNEHA